MIKYASFAIVMALVTCNMEHKQVAHVVSIKDGVIGLADGSTAPIPHYADTAYTIIYAVRHAEKSTDGTDNPSLSAEGVARAARLGKIMDKNRLDRICTTNYKRTIETGKGVYATTLAPPFETFPVQAQSDWIQEVLQKDKGKKIFYVGHQNTVPELLNTLVNARKYQEIPGNEFGKLYVIATAGIGHTEVMEFTYE